MDEENSEAGQNDVRVLRPETMEAMMYHMSRIAADLQESGRDWVADPEAVLQTFDGGVHHRGDPSCPSCSIHYPKPHSETLNSSCHGLIHCWALDKPDGSLSYSAECESRDFRMVDEPFPSQD